MKKRTAPYWDEFGRQKMFIPFFIYGRDDIDVGPFEGFCRGFGAITGNEKRYQDTIGIYTAEGVYYNILIDTRLECAIPQFFIGDKPFSYPIVACFTMCGGLPVIDPATGIMLEPGQEQEGESAMNRDDIIEHLVSKYQEVLEEKDDEELLGTTLEKMREDAIGELLVLYRESVEDRDDEDLLGQSLEEMRENEIEVMVERFQEDLEAMTDEQLEEQCQ